jgi:hypothetical protein
LIRIGRVAKGSRVRGPKKPYGKGVAFHGRDKKWLAYISEDGIKRHLGYFDNEEDALAARAYALKDWVKSHERNSR